ncbi:MAG TPA: efflux RND transporter periplasmic adaptor subunit [Deltaproteobacteria bacterium]|nr:efflux RND transporter periplasmic adaptor subunit [Deltaproteobacteria bacterium]
MGGKRLVAALTVLAVVAAALFLWAMGMVELPWLGLVREDHLHGGKAPHGHEGIDSPDVMVTHDDEGPDGHDHGGEQSYAPYGGYEEDAHDHGGDAHDHGEEAHDHGGGGHGGHEEGVVRLDPTKRTAVELGEAVVRRGSLTTLIKLPAEVQWDADNLIHVTPRVDGIVLAVEKSLGDRVKEGELLVTLDSPEMGRARMEFLTDLNRMALAEVDFERARTIYENTKKLLAVLDERPAPREALERARRLPSGENKNLLLTKYTVMHVNERNFRREKKLFEKKISSEADYLAAESAYETARADFYSTYEEIGFNLEIDFLKAKNEFEIAKNEILNSERTLHILGLTKKETDTLRKEGAELHSEISRTGLYSPVNGVIVERHVSRGERVGRESTLFKIADTSRMWVMASVYERDLRFLHKGQKALVRLDAYPGETMEGVIDYIGSELAPDTRTVQARVVLPNRDGRLRAGMFGSVTLFSGNTGRKDTGLLVPVDALQRSEAGYVVFRVKGEDEFEEVAVEVLRKSADFALISGPVREGERVATGDLFILKAEAGKEEMGGGHSH